MFTHVGTWHAVTVSMSLRKGRFICVLFISYYIALVRSASQTVCKFLLVSPHGLAKATGQTSYNEFRGVKNDP
jgi:hypothetical protein